MGFGPGFELPTPEMEDDYITHDTNQPNLPSPPI